MKNQIKNGIVHAVVFFLTLGILSIGYAAITNVWTNTDTLEVSSGSTLSATSWNKLLGNFEFLKSKTENIYNSGTNIGIGISPNQKLSVAGTIESTTGGYKFPDGTIQTTASNQKYLFKAYLGNSHFTISGNQIIPFSIEEYDIGNIYNPSTYTVTIPKNGYYEFCVNILGSASTYLHYMINGGLPLGYQGTSSRITISGCYINYYSVGNTVNIQTSTGDSGTLHQGNRSTFYGRFLY